MADLYEEDDAFPMEVLPPEIRTFIEAIEKSALCGVTIPATAALGVVGCAIGPGIRVYGHKGDDLGTPPNVHVIIVAPSGSGKSRNAEPIFRPLNAYQDELLDHFYGVEKPLLESKLKLLAREAKKIESRKEGKQANGSKANPVELDSPDFTKASAKSESEELAEIIREQAKIREALDPPRVIMEDFTVQVLNRMLGRNKGRMLILSSDARETVNNILGRYNKGKPDENIYLKGWTCERYTYDRKGENGQMVSEVIPVVVLGVVLMVQEDKANEMIESASLAEGGFLPRVQVVFTDEKGGLPSKAVPIPEGLCRDWDTLVRGLMRRFYALPEPIRVYLSPEACRIWCDYADSRAIQRNQEQKDHAVFTSRDAECARRYAAILHAMKHGIDLGKHEISSDTMRGAITLVEYFGRHRARIAQSRQAYREEKQLKKLRDLAGHCNGIIPLRDIMRKRVCGNDKLRSNKAQMDDLEARGIVEQQPDPDGQIRYRLL